TEGFFSTLVRQHADLSGLRALGPLRGHVAHALVLFQRLEAFAFDFRKVREEILAAVLGHDEAKALFSVEPFDDAGFHSTSLINITFERLLEQTIKEGLKTMMAR